MKLQKRIEEKRSAIVDLYKKGVSVSKIAETLCVSKLALRKVLELENIKLRTQSEQQFLDNGSGDLNHSAFDVLTPEALYWIGFIYADGYVIHNKSGRYMITIDLNSRDRKHLEMFRNFLSAGVKVRDSIRKRNDKEYRTSIISISSKPLFDKLTELNFTSNKTYDATVHSELVNSRDFWRGLFDGDGWISKSHTRKYKYVWVGLCGTIDTVQCFIDFVKTQGIETSVTNARYKKGTVNNYEIAFVNKVGHKVLHLLYKDSTTYLDRKYQKYLEICSGVEENEPG